MKKSVFLLPIFMILFITSCSDSEQLIRINDESALQVNHAISQQSAISIAVEALGTLSQDSDIATRAASRMWQMRDIQCYIPVTTRASFNDKNSFYIINFEGGGFAIVPTDDRASDIYALSLEGSFNIEDNDEAKYFMHRASEYMEKEIALASELTPAPGPDDPSIYMIEEYGGEYYHAKYEYSQTTPFYLLKTEWTQHEPYRRFCFTPTGKNAVAGCVAIAMAQIMAYHKKPESYNGHNYLWDRTLQYSYVSINSPVADNVAYLIHDIGVVVDMDYGESKSGTNSSKATPGFRQFGYSADTPTGYSLDRILSSLKDSHPVYISATSGNEGHAWVLDGYYRKNTKITYYTINTKEVYTIVNKSSFYLHCNWGWGSSNGYFLEGAFQPTGYLFDRDFKIVTNIH